LGAGTDHIDKDPALKQLSEIPVVRLIDPDVGMDMAHYVLYWAMHFQRGYEAYRKQALDCQWQRNAGKRIAETRVTVLGLGLIGRFVTEQIGRMGFIAQAWSRSQHEIEGISCFAGASGLGEVLAQTDVLVNCLPLNDQTHGMLNDGVFRSLPRGASFISISRGAIVDENALITALSSGQLAAAALDCFATEPLPEQSLFWQLPNVYVTPHMAGATFARSAAKVVAENILRMERGEPPFPLRT
jgi:glyoxylate/hydroxypyruvate reductase A